MVQNACYYYNLSIVLHNYRDRRAFQNKTRTTEYAMPETEIASRLSINERGNQACSQAFGESAFNGSRASIFLLVMFVLLMELLRRVRFSTCCSRLFLSRSDMRGAPLRSFLLLTQAGLVRHIVRRAASTDVPAAHTAAAAARPDPVATSSTGRRLLVNLLAVR